VQTQETQETEKAAKTAVEAMAVAKSPRRILPAWAAFSVAANGLLLLSISLLYWKPQLLNLNRPEQAAEVSVVEVSPAPEPAETTPPQSQYTYTQWLEVLGKEAGAMAKAKPEHLTVLLGDSLSLWFPVEMLPSDRVWLNQGVSGENSAGLLKRLNLLDELQPETIVVMVGINDLIKGTSDEQILDNYRQIIQTLKEKHPKSSLVVQSVLPHGGDRVGTIDREQVLQLSNERIYQFNQKLGSLTAESEVLFLNLHPLFTDGDGLMQADLSTDGLHLKRQGYFVWRSAFQLFSQLLLPKVTSVKAARTAPDEAPAETAPPEAAPETPAIP
jgi:lysophospholipase L1-like esterase